ncbi:MAG: TetR/AcrR family transcriptional regulator [Actinomycetota bacterium]
MPRKASGQAQRARIVAATARLIAAKGPQAMSMREIAGEAGCTIGLINHWFDSKDQLIEAVLDQAAADASARCRTALEHADVTLEQILAEFLPLDEQRQRELTTWYVFWALSIGKPNLQAVYRTRMKALRDDLTTNLATNGVPESELAEYVDAVMAAVDGIAISSLAEPQHWTRARQRRTLSRLLAAVPMSEPIQR